MFKSNIISDIDFNNKEKAIALIYEKVYPQIRKYILFNKGTLEDAEDIFQESVITFFNKLDYYAQNDVNVTALLMTIAKNKWTDLVRSRKHKNVNIDDVYHDISDTEFADNDIIKFEMDAKINTILDAVGERCKELLINILFYDMSMKDVAVKMSFLNENSAKTQHYKCRQKLIDLFKNDKALKIYLQSAHLK